MVEERAPKSATPRALLGGSIALATLPPVQAVAAQERVADEKLLSLLEDYKLVQTALEEVDREDNAAFEARIALIPPRPASLTGLRRDVWDYGASPHQIGIPLTDKMVAELERQLPKLRDNAAKYPNEINIPKLGRAEEVVADHAEWRKHESHPGYIAAVARCSRAAEAGGRLCKHASAIQDQMLALAAATVAGLAAKAALCNPPERDEDEEWISTVYRSLHADLLAMEG